MTQKDNMPVVIHEDIANATIHPSDHFQISATLIIAIVWITIIKCFILIFLCQ